MRIIFYQNYHDEMALRIQITEHMTYFQVLKKGNVVSEMVEPYRLMNAYEIKQKKERSLGCERIKFKIKNRVENNDAYPDKYLIVEIYKDSLVKITDELNSWSKILEKASKEHEC